jgi:hypothetical protein
VLQYSFSRRAAAILGWLPRRATGGGPPASGLKDTVARDQDDGCLHSPLSPRCSRWHSRGALLGTAPSRSGLADTPVKRRSWAIKRSRCSSVQSAASQIKTSPVSVSFISMKCWLDKRTITRLPEARESSRSDNGMRFRSMSSRVRTQFFRSCGHNCGHRMVAPRF